MCPLAACAEKDYIVLSSTTDSLVVYEVQEGEWLSDEELDLRINRAAKHTCPPIIELLPGDRVDALLEEERCSKNQ